MDDLAEVMRVLNMFSDGLTLRLIASALNWRSTKGRTLLDTRRVDRALLDLVLEKKVEQVNKRWRVRRDKT